MAEDTVAAPSLFADIFCHILLWVFGIHHFVGFDPNNIFASPESPAPHDDPSSLEGIRRPTPHEQEALVGCQLWDAQACNLLRGPVILNDSGGPLMILIPRRVNQDNVKPGLQCSSQFQGFDITIQEHRWSGSVLYKFVLHVDQLFQVRVFIKAQFIFGISDKVLRPFVRVEEILRVIILVHEHGRRILCRHHVHRLLLLLLECHGLGSWATVRFKHNRLLIRIQAERLEGGKMVAIVHVPCPLQWRHDPHHWWWWWGTGFIKRPAMAAMEILTVHQVWRHGPRTDEVRLWSTVHAHALSHSTVADRSRTAVEMPRAPHGFVRLFTTQVQILLVVAHRWSYRPTWNHARWSEVMVHFWMHTV
mmetsp:Transcript_38000/g.61880  ORF Transcript_38000/g.61880 Transcript_38000/m.61880 type:complete len:362 (+) Transcript_38000:2283-3368(+)